MNDAVAVGNPCKRLILPAGVYGFNAPIKSSTAACTNPVGTVTQNVHSWGVNGQGTGQTYLVLDPDGNYNSPGSNSAIMFDTPGAIGVDFEDFTVTGGGNATCTATTNPTFFFMGGYLSTFRNLDVDNACNNTGTVDAFGFCNGAAVAAGCHIENVNSWNGGFFCGQLWSGSYYNLQCQTQGGVTAMHGNVNTYGSSFLAGQSTNVVTTVGIVWNSYSDTIQNFGSTANMIQNLGTVNLDGTNLTSVASGAILWFNGATAATYHLHNVNFSSGSAKLTTNAAAGSQIIDQCGNLLPGIASSTFTNILFVPCPTMTYTAAVPQVGATGTGSCGTITTQIGNILNGSLKCTAASASATVVLTPGITAQNGWTCTGVDLTTTTATPLQTASNGTTCTLASAGILQNDVIAFSLNQF
jgi:hypothetical protein